MKLPLKIYRNFFTFTAFYLFMTLMLLALPIGGIMIAEKSSPPLVIYILPVVWIIIMFGAYKQRNTILKPALELHQDKIIVNCISNVTFAGKKARVRNNGFRIIFSNWQSFMTRVSFHEPLTAPTIIDRANLADIKADYDGTGYNIRVELDREYEFAVAGQRLHLKTLEILGPLNHDCDYLNACFARYKAAAKKPEESITI